MPAEQRGSYYRTKNGWGVRWYREDGRRSRKSGFPTKGAARKWFEEVEHPRMLGVPDQAQAEVTLSVFVNQYIAQHEATCEPSTIETLRQRLEYATLAFGEVPLRDIEDRAAEIATWRGTLPEGSRYGITQALRQTLDAAARWGLIERNPAKLPGRNPQPKRGEITPFTRDEIDALAVEIEPWGSLVVFASETGLRPCEWRALEWRDVDGSEKTLRVERSFSRGIQKSYGKTARSRRRVPLSGRALNVLEQWPRRINTKLVFPAPDGGGGVEVGHGEYLDLHNWRARNWRDALDAAGLPKRRIYDMRHTFATLALAAGISIFELARYMGTSVRMIDQTYGHLAPGSEADASRRLDALGLGEDENTDRLGH